MHSEIGKWLLFIGLAIVFVGVVLYFFGDKFEWLGRLPGDISIERENFNFYFPITTMILLSVVVSLIIRLFRALF